MIPGLIVAAQMPTQPEIDRAMCDLRWLVDPRSKERTLQYRVLRDKKWSEWAEVPNVPVIDRVKEE